jgi:hypothetical protein
MSKLSQEAIDKIKEEAETYSGTQVWVNKNSSPEHLFHEFISATSFERGATEEAGRAQGPVLTLELIRVWVNECKDHGKLLDADKAIAAIDTALAKYKEVGNG